MSRKREVLFMGIGILAGITLSGPAAQAATELLTASPTSQTFYLNGQKVEFEAYCIHDNNFVKLRDIAQAVDFGVAYDAATNSVHIDPDAPYQEEAASALTEAAVQATIWALRDVYPTGTVYGEFFRSYSNGPYGMAPNHCAGWATLCSDAAFGDLPWRRINSPSWGDIRPGDLIRYDNTSGGHVVVVLDKKGEYIKVTESGTNNKGISDLIEIFCKKAQYIVLFCMPKINIQNKSEVPKARWGGKYFRWWLEEQPGYTCFTRYP